MEIVGFDTNNGAFNGRQHVINHVDMILGIGGGETRIRKGRLLRTMAMQVGEEVAVASLSDKQLAKTREEILRLSVFACEWQQLMPEIAEGQMIPEDFHSRDDGVLALNACVRRWADTFYSGDLDAFWSKTAVVVLMACWVPVTCDRIVVRRMPDGEQSGIPVPVNSKSLMRRRHGNSAGWKMFAEGVCKNTHVKAGLFESQKGVCPICGMALGESFVVHHVDYDHECWQISTESESRLSRSCFMTLPANLCFFSRIGV